MALPVIAGRLLVKEAIKWQAKVNWPLAWRAVKAGLGVSAVAAAVGMDEDTFVSELAQNVPRTKRRRGITARQLANARRVNRIVCNWHKQLTAAPRARRCKS